MWKSPNQLGDLVASYDILTLVVKREEVV